MNIITQLFDVIATFLEAFLLYRVAELLLLRRFKTDERYIKVSLGVLICACVIVCLGLNQIKLTSPYLTIILMWYNILIVILFWKCDFFKATAIVGGYFFLLFVTEMIYVSIIGMIGGEELIYEVSITKGLARLIYIICGKINWTFINVFLYKILKRYKLYENNEKYIGAVSLIGCFGLMFICGQMLVSFNITIGIVGYVFLGVCVICIFTAYYMIKSRNLKEQIQMIHSQNEILARNYEQVSNYYEANAHLYHDMKNHLQAIHYMLEEGKGNEAKHYLESLKTPTHIYVVKHWTSIDIVDTILSDKAAIAEKNGISILIDSQILPQDIKIEKRDLCAVFANLLDNAIEASPSKIKVSIKLSECLLLVQVKNDYVREIKKENGRYRTTKENMMYHGWGLQSVESVANRYGGSMEASVKNGMFCVDIMLTVF